MSNKTLSTFRFPNGTCIAQAQPRGQAKVTLGSPALQVMTDLTEVRAATVQSDMSLAQAEAAMVHLGVRMLFVVDHMPCVDGIVTAAALLGDRPMQVMQARGVTREDLTVADVMHALADLDVVDLGTLQRASVGDVVATLTQFGHPHLLVVEGASAQGPARIRGVVSQTQVERQLGHPLPMHEVAHTFVEIEQALV